MYTQKEYQKAAKRGRMQIKIGRYLMTRHDSRFHNWLKAKLRALAGRQYPKDSLDFLENEQTRDDH